MKTDVKYTLLYAEDEAYVRRAVVGFLKDFFTEIYEAKDGEEALALYHDKTPDMMITDIEMPKMDGLALCKKIRQKDRTLPIIIMTAYTHTEYLLEATELNLVKYLIKPVEEEAFLEALDLCFNALASKDPSIIELGEGYRYDHFNQTLFHKKSLIQLTATQTNLLHLLVKNRGYPVSYTQLEQSVWYEEGMSKDALRCAVRDIRKQTYKGIIENISKIGYKVHIDG